MRAVSSFRPLADCTPAIRANQLAAKRSWDKTFDHIIYLNDYDSEMAGPKTEFIPGDPFPQIADLIDWCAEDDDWSCIVNADIVVRPDVFKRIVKDLVRLEALSAISRRWEFDPAASVRTLSLADLGLDIFCAVGDIWKEAADWIPDQFHLGHCLWDTWMLGFLNVTSDSRWYDFTPSKCILHPKHADRKHLHVIDVSYRDRYLANVNFPKLKLT